MRGVYEASDATLLCALGLALLSTGCVVNRSSLGEAEEPAHARDAALGHVQDAAVSAMPTSTTAPTSPAAPMSPAMSTSALPPASALTPALPSDASVSDAGRPAAADAEANDAALTDAAPADSAGTDAGCDVSGSFALRIDAEASWAGTTLFNIVPIIKPGSGTLSVVLLADLHADHSATLRACGANVPDFSASVGETYGVVFPDDLWEKLSMRWSVGTSSMCLEPSCGLSFDPIVAQLGIGIPEQASWPTSRDKLDGALLRDDDRDGVPGVLLRCRGPKEPGAGKYQHPPTSYALNTRVSEIMMAIRIVAQLEARLASCDSFGGTIQMMSVDTRALACQLDTGTRCLPEQLAFVDDNLPVWKVYNASFQAARVSTGASCADVRAVMPP